VAKHFSWSARRIASSSRIEAETSGFYRLGVEAPSLSDKRRYLSTKVSVKNVRDDRARESGACRRRGAASCRSRINCARLTQGGVAFGVPMRSGRPQRRDPATSAFQLAVNVPGPSSVEGPLVAMAGWSMISANHSERRKDVPTPTAARTMCSPSRFPSALGATDFALS
jgi:hypothetical protein